MRKSGCRLKKRDRRIAGCRTKRVGSVIPGNGKPLFYCSLDETDCCYAFPVGYDVICKHPEPEQFEAEQPVPHPFH